MSEVTEPETCRSPEPSLNHQTPHTTHHTEVPSLGSPAVQEPLDIKPGRRNSPPAGSQSSQQALRSLASGRSQAPEDRRETTFPKRLRGARLTGGSEAGDGVTKLRDAGARGLNCGGLRALRLRRVRGVGGSWCVSFPAHLPTDCPMDSALQARLFPGLDIKIQRSNGEGRGPRPGGPWARRRLKLLPLPKRQGPETLLGSPLTTHPGLGTGNPSSPPGPGAPARRSVPSGPLGEGGAPRGPRS